MLDRTVLHPAMGRRSTRLAILALVVLGLGVATIVASSGYQVLRSASESFAWYMTPPTAASVEGRSVRVGPAR
jgi:hypothetical protein